MGADDNIAARKELAQKFAERVASESKSREEIAEAQAKLREAYEARKISLDALTTADKELEAASQKLLEAERKNLESKLGLSIEKPKTQEEVPESNLKDLQEALNEGTINAEEFADINKRLTDRYKENVLGELQGFKELIEVGKKQKTAAEEYAENVEKINEALRRGAIDRREYQQAMNAADEKLADAEKSTRGTKGTRGATSGGRSGEAP